MASIRQNHDGKESSASKKSRDGALFTDVHAMGSAGWVTENIGTTAAVPGVRDV